MMELMLGTVLAVAVPLVGCCDLGEVCGWGRSRDLGEKLGLMCSFGDGA